jgi:hypothetical protein
MMMFRLWQNALLEKVSVVQLCPLDSAASTRNFLPTWMPSHGKLAFPVALANSKGAYIFSWSENTPDLDEGLILPLILLT